MAGTVAFALSTLIVDRGPPSHSVFWDTFVYLGVFAAITVACAVRAVRHDSDRSLWIGVSAGLALWTSAEFVLTVHDSNADNLPVHSISDVLFLAGYPALYYGLVTAARRRGHFHGTGMLDCAIAALGIAGASALVLLGPFGGPFVESDVFASELTFVLLDSAVLALAATALSRRAGRLEWTRIVLAAGLLVDTIADGIYGYLIAADRYTEGTSFDATWLAGIVMIGAATLSPPDETQPLRSPDRRESAGIPWLALGAGVVSIVVVWLDAAVEVPATAITCASFCLVGVLGRLVQALREVTRLHGNHDEARTDDLTGLKNRRWLREHVAHELAGCAPVSLAVVDLDGFKDINDALGHDVGDILLTGVAHRLVNALPADCHVVRLGGDEFGVAASCSDTDLAEHARRAADAIAAPFALDGLRLVVTASFGVAGTGPFDGPITSGELLKRADIAMYDAKRHRHGAAIHDRSSETKRRDRLMLVEELRNTITQDGLVALYQPIVALDRARSPRVEALLRWPHPQRGLLLPGSFLDIAEQTGQMRPITRSILNQALRDAGSWQPENPTGVSVNVSPADLLDETFPDETGAALASYGLPGNALTIEITEHSLIVDPDRAQRSISRLREQGVRVAIDDFGVGYSSLKQLLNFEIDELKIDRSFTAAALHDPRARAIIESTVHLARNLGLDVVAEGIETAQIMDLATALGCSHLQGLHIAAPQTSTTYAASLTPSRR